MDCPYCGVVLDEAQRVWFVFYRSGLAAPGAIITCEQDGERHHVELLTPSDRSVRWRRCGPPGRNGGVRGVGADEPDPTISRDPKS